MEKPAGDIAFRGVTKKFGEIVALENLTFEIEKGEFVFVTGPSGAGKTTIVRLILREMLPTSGEIKIADWDLVKMPSSKIPFFRRRIGVVFQDFKLLFDRTVFENVALPLEVIGKNETEIKKEVLEILDLVGLAERAGLFPAQLAGGELQRTCLARAVIGKPEIILADEPTGNLDPKTTWEIMRIFKKLEDTKTIIIATHNTDIVNSLKKRVIVLKDGKITNDKKNGGYDT